MVSIRAASLLTLLAGVEAGSTWVEPEVRKSQDGVLETTFTVGVSEFHGEGISFLTRSYEGQVPGPTLLLKPGDTLKLTLKNALGDDSDVPALPNTTNFHTHGLHVSPLEDNVFVNVSGGDAHTYEIHVPEDHIQGTFYYHPHRLPADLIQVLGGMAGLIIVEDEETWPKELREMKRHAVVLQKWLWCRNATDPCGWNAAGHVMHTDHYWFPAIQHLEGPTTLPAVTSPADWTDVEYLSVNGVYQPTLEIEEGEHRYLRVLNTAVDIQLNLQLDEPCRMWVLGTDGTYIDGPRLVPNNKVILSTADRLDLIVQCPEAGQFELRNVLFSNEEVDYMGHPAYDEHSMPRAQSLFTFDVKRTENVKTKLPQSLPARPVWMHDLRTIPDEDVHIQRTVWMAGVPSVAGESSPYSYGVVNGIKLPGYWGDAVKPEFFLKQDRLEEWIIYNRPPNCTPLANDTDQCTIDGGDGTVWDTGSGHVLHMHTNHFQIVRTIPEDAQGLDFAVGEFHDTIFFGHNAPSLVIRFRFANFTGPTLYHCHYLKHTNQGMASAIVGVPGMAGMQAPCHNATGAVMV